jgi:hypothetical protein
VCLREEANPPNQARKERELKNSFHPSLGFDFFPMANAAISMAYHRLPQTLCRPQEGRRLVQQWNSAATRPQHIIWARSSTSSTIPTQTQKDQQIRTTGWFFTKNNTEKNYLFYHCCSPTSFDEFDMDSELILLLLPHLQQDAVKNKP